MAGERAVAQSCGRGTALGLAYVVLGVDICPCFQQRLHDRRVPVSAGISESGGATLPVGVAARRTGWASKRRHMRQLTATSSAPTAHTRQRGGSTSLLALTSAPASNRACTIGACPPQLAIKRAVSPNYQVKPRCGVSARWWRIVARAGRRGGAWCLQMQAPCSW